MVVAYQMALLHSPRPPGEDIHPPTAKSKADDADSLRLPAMWEYLVFVINIITLRPDWTQQKAPDNRPGLNIIFRLRPGI